MLNSLAIANRILDLAALKGMSVTPMQLQKLMYFCNGWHIETTRGQPLTNNFEAWQFGPVLPVVYNYFKTFGSQTITSRATSALDPNPLVPQLNTHQQQLINSVLDIYGNLSGPQMSNLTHKDGTPWHKTWNSGLGSRDTINTSLILEHFNTIRQASAA